MGGGIFDLGWVFMTVLVLVEVLAFVVKLDAGLDLLDGETFFLWPLILMSVEANISNARGYLCGIAVRADFLSFLFLDIGRLGKMMNAKAEIEVVAKVVASVKWNRNKCGNKCRSLWCG